MRFKRLEPLAGVAFVFLVVAAALLVNNYSYLSSEADLQAFFTENATRLQVAGYVGALSAAFLIWYAGWLRSRLRTLEGGSGRLSGLSFAGAITAAVLVAAAFAILTAGAARGGSAGGINAATAVTLYDVYGSITGLALPITFGVFIAATALVCTRAGIWPAPLTWASAVLAVGSLSPLGWVFIGFDLLWLLVVSIGTYVKLGPLMASKDANT